jgi:hypothetical protein
MVVETLVNTIGDGFFCIIRRLQCCLDQHLYRFVLSETVSGGMYGACTVAEAVVTQGEPHEVQANVDIAFLIHAPNEIGVDVMGVIAAVFP